MISYLVYIAVIVVYLFISYTMYLETKGLSIEETSVIFDRGTKSVVGSGGHHEESVEYKQKVEDVQMEDCEKPRMS